MSNTSTSRPQAFTNRINKPEHLFILVNPNQLANADTPDIFAPANFNWSDVTKANISAHLHNALASSPFLTAYSTATKAFKSLLISAEDTNIVGKLSTRALVPATAYTTRDQEIPVWIEQGPLPRLPAGVLYVSTKGFEAFKSSLWICVDELRDLSGLEGFEGVWLACGGVSGRMVGGVDDGVASMKEMGMASVKMRDGEIEKEERKRLGKEQERWGKKGNAPAWVAKNIPVRGSSLGRMAGVDLHVPEDERGNSDWEADFLQDCVDADERGDSDWEGDLLQDYVPDCSLTRPDSMNDTHYPDLPTLWEEVAAEYDPSSPPTSPTPVPRTSTTTTPTSPFQNLPTITSNQPSPSSSRTLQITLSPPRTSTPTHHTVASSHLIYPRNPHFSARTTATLARLEDTQLTMWAWKMWRDDVLERRCKDAIIRRMGFAGTRRYGSD
jgi:hypothetical protein